MNTFENYQLNILQQDTLIQQIPVDDYQVILDKVAEHCHSIIQKYWSIIQNETLLHWVLQQGIAINFQTKSAQQSRVLFGEYCMNEKKITLYEETIRNHPLTFVPNTMEFTLFHEIYHVIEAIEKSNYQNYYQITQKILGPIKVKSGLLSFSELAANYFSHWILNYWRNNNEEITEKN